MAPEGIPAMPATLTTIVVPAPRGEPAFAVPLHWAWAPPSPDGLPGRVSQTRTGAAPVVYCAPVPEVAEYQPETSTRTSVA